MSYKLLLTWAEFLEQQAQEAADRSRRDATIVTEYTVRVFSDGTVRWFQDDKEVDQPAQ